MSDPSLRGMPTFIRRFSVAVVTRTGDGPVRRPAGKSSTPTTRTADCWRTALRSPPSTAPCPCAPPKPVRSSPRQLRLHEPVKRRSEKMRLPCRCAMKDRRSRPSCCSRVASSAPGSYPRQPPPFSSRGQPTAQLATYTLSRLVLASRLQRRGCWNISLAGRLLRRQQRPLAFRRARPRQEMT
jgi:hypothetical protein